VVDLVVVLNGFPRLSETFVLQELLELERQGAKLHVVALRKPEESLQQERVAELEAKVEYLPELSPELLTSAAKLRVRVGHAALVLRRPAGYVNALGEILASPDFSRTALRRAVLLAHRVQLLGSPPIYVHFVHKPATVGRFAARLAGVPFGVSAHAKDIWLTPPAELAQKVRDAEVVLTCTSAGREYLAGLGAGRTPVRLAYHGIDVDAFDAASPEQEPPTILSAGRLVPKKGYATLVRAAGSLRDSGFAFRLQLAGEGPQWPVLQRLVHELDLGDRVEFLGPLTAAELVERYARAQVFALACEELETGDRDGIPNVILEAMASGLPIASTRCGGVTEAIADGECGLLAPQADPKAFASVLERLLADPALRAQLGAQARASVVERFDSRRHLAGVVDALHGARLVPAIAARHEEASPEATLAPA
jgi:glycosyltransferase involved in cell wall biosynthesis